MSTDIKDQVQDDNAGNDGQWLSTLLPQHQQLLEQSGITQDVARSRGCRSVKTKVELHRLGFSRGQQQVPAFVLPIYDLSGKAAQCQIRPDNPRTYKGKVAKYEVPYGSELVIDVPPRARESVLRGDVRLFVVLGVRKADSLVSQGECCISLLNIRGWDKHAAFWTTVPLQGREVHVVLDSDAPTDKAMVRFATRFKAFLAARGATVQVVAVPADETAERVGVDDFLSAGHGVDDLLTLDPLNLPESAGDSAEGPRYLQTPEGMYVETGSRRETIPKRLTNFTARIVCELQVTDGVEERREFEIEASVKGDIRRITVRADEFDRMEWVTKYLGAGATVYAGYGYRDHARVAILELSNDIRKERVYTHIGWVKMGDERLFLHAGGAIGAGPQVERDAGPAEGALQNSSLGNDLCRNGPNGPLSAHNIGNIPIRVHVPNSLRGFTLPAPSKGGLIAVGILESLQLLELGPDHIVLLLYAALWRAPLGPTSYSVWIDGRTGSGKTTLAALFQQFFGPGMDGENLPGSWTSTANALEATTFLAKDVLFVVDDWMLQGSQSDINRAHRDADRLVRGQTNQAGRSRCLSDGTPRAAKPSRSLIVTTGEATPDGHSLNARLLRIDTANFNLVKDSPPKVLWMCQHNARRGYYAKLMAAYLQWLAPQYEKRVAQQRKRMEEFRNKNRSLCTHPRTSTMIADLQAGFEVFLDFAHEIGGISTDDYHSLWHRLNNALVQLADEHNEQQADTDPVNRFLSLLRSAFVAGRAHLADPDEGRPAENADALGWIVKSRWVRRRDFGAPPNGSENAESDQPADGVDDDDLIEVENARPLGTRIGWVVDWQVYLDVEAVLAVVQNLAKQIGQPLPLDERTLPRAYNGLDKLGASIRWIRNWSDKGCRRRIHGEETTGIYGSLPSESRVGGNSWGGDAGRIGEPV